MHLWWKISYSLQETIQAKCKLDGCMDCDDLAICSCLNFHFRDEFSGVVGQWYHNVPNHPRHQWKWWVNRVGHWSPPPPRVLKDNTNGSSQGNPSPIVIGGVAQCSFREVQFIFLVHKGWHINNLIEVLVILYVVEQCCLRGWLWLSRGGEFAYFTVAWGC